MKTVRMGQFWIHSALRLVSKSLSNSRPDFCWGKSMMTAKFHLKLRDINVTNHRYVVCYDYSHSTKYYVCSKFQEYWILHLLWLLGSVRSPNLYISLLLAAGVLPRYYILAHFNHNDLVGLSDYDLNLFCIHSLFYLVRENGQMIPRLMSMQCSEAQATIPYNMI
jgi:hypothetical protein